MRIPEPYGVRKWEDKNCLCLIAMPIFDRLLGSISFLNLVFVYISVKTKHMFGFAVELKNHVMNNHNFDKRYTLDFQNIYNAQGRRDHGGQGWPWSPPRFAIFFLY